MDVNLLTKHEACEVDECVKTISLTCVLPKKCFSLHVMSCSEGPVLHNLTSQKSILCQWEDLVCQLVCSVWHTFGRADCIRHQSQMQKGKCRQHLDGRGQL